MEITGFTLKELEEKLISFGMKKFRAKQIFKWVYDKGVFDFHKMTNISKEQRSFLSENFKLSLPTVEFMQKSVDGTVKFALKLCDGNIVESVLIPDEKRNTLCVSTQVGCRMGCKFCFTARMGFKRNLSVAEIISQIIIAKFVISSDKPVTNLVFMGMGEPLDNFDNLVKSLKIILETEGLNFSSRRVTVSTCGLIDKMESFGKEFDINLAVSLHSAFDEKRSEIMPVNKKFNLSQLIKACKNYPLKNRQRITFEYIMIKDYNDSLEDAKKVVSVLGDLKSKVNLIRFNGFPDTFFQPSQYNVVRKFQEYVISKGITATLRKSKGEDILAACGQLAGKNIN